MDESPVNIPAQGDVADFFGAHGWRIVGMRQKVTLISPSCAIAWAGSYLGARIAIAKLRELAANGELTVQKVLEYLNTDEDMRQHAIQIVGWIHGGNYVDHFQYECASHSNLVSSCFYVGGSGAELFLDAAQQELSQGSKNAHTSFYGIGYSLSVAGLFLQRRIRINPPQQFWRGI